MQSDKRIVFDLETKKGFAEVGGHRNAHMLGVSVAGLYRYETDEFKAYEEKELGDLEKVMAEASLVVGFNIKRFDYLVLQPYFKNIVLADLPTLDLMAELETVLGFRPGLGALAQSTLGEQKSSHGLEALEWFRQGETDKVKEYCLQDVKLTRDLYEYGLNHGSVLFEPRAGGLKAVPVIWGAGLEKKDIRAVLTSALSNKEVVEIDYVSMRAEDGEEARKRRNIEIYSINGDTVEAFCHTRQDKRYFKMRRILDAKAVGASQRLPALF